jgi:hypothetical protein
MIKKPTALMLKYHSLNDITVLISLTLNQSKESLTEQCELI